MLFRHKLAPRDLPVVTVQRSPNKGLKIHTPKTLEEIITLSACLPRTAHQSGGADISHRSRGSSQNNSSLEHCKNPAPEWKPTSKKTGFATIQTEATNTQAAFESDAFAVLMPTTRLPILDRPMSPKKPSPGARAEAYRMYQEKARQGRERNNSQGVQVPSKLVSYGYTSITKDGQRASLQVELSPSNSPPPHLAGSFPISPPLAQGGWTRTERVTTTPTQIQELPSVSPPRKVVTSKPTATSSTPTPISFHRVDSKARAQCSTPSSTPLPPTIRAYVKPRATPVPGQDRVQTESRYSLYNRPLPRPPTPTSRSTNPVKSMPNFARHKSIEGDSIFGYNYRDHDVTMIGASDPVKPASPSKKAGKINEVQSLRRKAADRANVFPPKRSLTQRWPWLRPSGPRIGKPTITSVVFAAPVLAPIDTSTATTIKRTSGYVDPFTSPTTPPSPPLSLRTAYPPSSPVKLTSPGKSSSPVKLTCHTIPAPTSPTLKFDSGFAQIKAFAHLLLKMCLFVYAIVAMWYVLDAVREAFQTLGAPFRLLRWLGGWMWVWSVSLGRGLMGMRGK